MNSKQSNSNGKSSGSQNSGSSFVKRSDTILFNDHPRSFLNFEGLDDNGGDVNLSQAIKIGAIISEVGPPTKIQAGGNNLTGFDLRKSTKVKLPSHIFGKCHVGDALSDWGNGTTLPIPAVGTSVIVPVTFTPRLEYFSAMYEAGRWDAVYLIACEEPLGANQMLSLSATELNRDNKVRDIKWRPQQVPVIVVRIPYIHHSCVVRRQVNNTTIATDMKALGSYSLKVTCLADNTVTSVSRPVKLTIWSTVTNVHLSGLIPSPVAGATSLFTRSYVANTPEDAPTREIQRVELQMEEIEPNAAADMSAADPASAIPAQAGDAIESTPIATILPDASSGQIATPGNQLGSQVGKWHLWDTYSLSDADIGKPINIDFDPDQLDKKEGESLMKPFRRNVYFAHSQAGGYTQGYHFKIVSVRGPYFAGRISIGNYSNLGASAHQVYTHVIGGAATEFSLQTPYHTYPGMNFKEKFTNSPFLFTRSERKVSGFLRLDQFNRTDEKADFSVQIFVRPGNTTFQVPLKPKPKPKVPAVEPVPRDVESLTAGSLFAIVDFARRVTLQSEEIDPSSFGVGGAEAPEHGAVTSTFEDEGLDQDSFWTCVGTFELKPGVVTSVPLMLPTLPDAFGYKGTSAIADKFSRFANFEPQGVSDFGPAIGDYKLIVHMPSTVTANLAHVCVPGDMNDLAATRILGLDSILSLAGTAISSIGGGVLNGAISTIGNILGSIGLKTPGNNKPSEPPNSLEGKIPFSRFFEIFRLVMGSKGDNMLEMANRFGTILMEVMDLFDISGKRVVGTIPVRVMVRMAVNPSTEIYERVDVAQVREIKSNRLMLTPGQQINVIEDLILADRLEEAAKFLSFIDLENPRSLHQLQEATASKSAINNLLAELRTRSVKLLAVH